MRPPGPCRWPRQHSAFAQRLGCCEEIQGLGDLGFKMWFVGFTGCIGFCELIGSRVYGVYRVVMVVRVRVWGYGVIRFVGFF